MPEVRAKLCVAMSSPSSVSIFATASPCLRLLSTIMLPIRGLRRRTVSRIVAGCRVYTALGGGSWSQSVRLRTSGVMAKKIAIEPGKRRLSCRGGSCRCFTECPTQIPLDRFEDRWQDCAQSCRPYLMPWICLFLRVAEERQGLARGWMWGSVGLWLINGAASCRFWVGERDD